MRLMPFVDDPKRYQGLRQVFAAGRWHEVVSVRAHGRGELMVLRLEGVTDREGAERFRGLECSVPATERPRLPAGRYYVNDLLGLCVVDQTGRVRGTVADVEALPAQDLLHVKSSGDGRDVLVPMVRAFVKAVDLKGQTVTVHAIPGLFPEDEAADERADGRPAGANPDRDAEDRSSLNQTERPS